MLSEVTWSEKFGEDTFQIHCDIKGKTFLMIIDEGSLSNLASTYVVEKYGLETVEHPHPYQLRGNDDHDAILVTRRVLVPFSVGRYEDEVVCDVVPLHASHVVIGKPWVEGRGAAYDEKKKRYKFHFDNRRIQLVCLSREQMDEGRAYMRKQFEAREVKMEVEVRDEKKEVELRK